MSPKGSKKDVKRQFAKASRRTTRHSLRMGRSGDVRLNNTPRGVKWAMS